MPPKLKFPKLDPMGIPLAELIALHQSAKPKHSLPENLGDGFLLATNPVFRAIRREFLHRGFRFSTSPNTDYYSFPLMSLDDALTKGKVPYRKNFHWLQKLEKQTPFTLTELKRSELQFNYLFHESAHFVAHAVLFGRLKPSRIPKSREGLLKVLLGEAFANTVECLSFLFVEGELGSYFLDANCHFRANEKEVRALLRTVRKTGLRRLAKAVLASFLYANYLYKEAGPTERRRIAKLAEVDDPKLLAPAIRVGFELSDIFRTDTTQLHLIKMGFPRNIEKLMAGDPVEMILRSRALSAKFHELAEVIVSELK